MSWMSKVTSMFWGRSHAGAASRSGPAGSSLVDNAPRADQDPPLIEVLPVSVGAGAPRARSRQELLDDLERNYREILDIARKVGANLDLEKERSARSEQMGKELIASTENIPAIIAEQTHHLREQQSAAAERVTKAIEEASSGIAAAAARADERGERASELAQRLVDAVERLPAVLIERMDRQQAEQASLLREAIMTTNAGNERVAHSLAKLADHAERADESQTRLVAALTDFRQTLGELGHTNTRSAGALEQMLEHSRSQERKIGSLLLDTRRMALVLVVCVVLVTLSVSAIAFVVLMRELN